MSAEPCRKKVYSSDMRWRIVYQRIGMHLPFEKIARNVNVATSTAHRIFKLFGVALWILTADLTEMIWRVFSDEHMHWTVYSAPKQEANFWTSSNYIVNSSIILFTHRNDIHHRYLHVKGLRCEFQLLNILSILKNRLCDVTDNIRCHRCAQWCQQIISQLKLLIFELSIS